MMTKSMTFIPWSLCATTLLFLGATAPATAQNCGEWTLKAESGPEPRFTALAFDSRRNVTVLYGGGGPGVHHQDTWEWDGTAWEKRDVQGPGGLEQHAVAFDKGRGETVLFGGSTGGGNDQDRTWLWDGIEWREGKCQPRPPARVNPCMAYDELNGVIVMFGGFSHPGNSFFGDTWGWDGSCWKLMSESGPSPRQGAAMTYDFSRQRIVMYGGAAGGGALSDSTIWEWDGTVWTPGGSCATPRRQQAMTFDECARKLVIFGGRDDAGYLQDTWVDCVDCRPGGPPTARTTVAAFDSDRDVTVLFGGNSDQGLLGDTWEYSISSCERDCLLLDVSNLIAGQTANFTVTGGIPGADCAVLWSNRDGSYIVDNGTWCAEFDFWLPSNPLTHLVAFGGFDVNGTFQATVRVPDAASGMDICFQTAMKDTCPETCMSNKWCGTIQ